MDEKFDKLDALILLAGDVLIEENLAYAREVLDPDIVISERTNRRILRYIRHTQKKSAYHPVLNVMKRAAVVMLVLGTVLFASAMSIEAVREKFWNAIVEWYEDYISVLFVDETEDTLMDVEFEVREPSYLPDGVAKGEQVEMQYYCYTTYYHNQKSLHLEQFIEPNKNTKIDNDNEECTIYNIKIHEYDGLLLKYENNTISHAIIWNDEQYWYKFISRSSTLNEAELLKIVKSIYNY